MPQSTVKSITARQKHIFSLSTPPTINVIEVQAISFKGHYKNVSGITPIFIDNLPFSVAQK